MKEIKIFFDGRNNLNEKLIRNNDIFNIVDCAENSDIIISQSTVNYPKLLHKTIYLSVEPPRTSHRIWCYDNYDFFKLVVCHNPDKNKLNQIPFTPDNNVQYYPYNSNAYQLNNRNDTTLKTRSVFFAGNIKRNSVETTNYKDSVNISKLRYIIGDYLIDKSKHNKFIGIGWNNQTSKVNDWRRNKMIEIEESGCDFVLALENTIYPNYLSEKIWDGINSDRVTLYLGDPNIEDHIPLNCFIDLREYYNTKTGDFCLFSFYNKLESISQLEYDEILFNARELKKTTFGKQLYYMNLLTTELITFIINEFKL